jgi:non-heme chloroperoxidase
MTKQEVNAFIVQTNTDRPKMLEEFGKIFFASNISDSFRQWFHSLGLAGSSHGTTAGLVSLSDEDLRADLAKVDAPTSIFHGVLDQICPFQFSLEMHKGIRYSVLVPFERSGHGLFYDELELFNQRLLMALNQIHYRIGSF